jgi:hypothetical protein
MFSNAKAFPIVIQFRSTLPVEQADASNGILYPLSYKKETIHRC